MKLVCVEDGAVSVIFVCGVECTSDKCVGRTKVVGLASNTIMRGGRPHVGLGNSASVKQADGHFCDDGDSHFICPVDIVQGMFPSTP